MQPGAGRHGALRSLGRADGHVLCKHLAEAQSCRIAAELQGRRSAIASASGRVCNRRQYNNRVPPSRVPRCVEHRVGQCVSKDKRTVNSTIV